MFRIIALIFLITFPGTAAATPEGARRVRRTHELATETWELKMKLARDPAEKREISQNRPDPAKTAAALWEQIAPSLARDWTIPHSAFFLNITRGLTTRDARGNTGPAFLQERRKIIETFKKHHLGKAGIGPFCIALLDSGDPGALSLFEEIIAENPDKSSRGVAALAASLFLKKLGDDPSVMKKRITYLRTAIINAAGQKIGPATTVADIAEDELFVITNLSKGRIAPDFSGTDVSGRTLSLSDFRGKITVVLFWDAKSTDTDKIIGITNRLTVKNARKPVAVIGITPESFDRIRELQGDGTIKWNNIIDPEEKITSAYRINTRPVVLILDEEGKIEYKGAPGSFVDLTVDALLSPGKTPDPE